MGKRELIYEYEIARAKFMHAINGLEEEDLLISGAVGHWSIKDVMAHLTAWESELITALVRIENGNASIPNIVKIDDIDEWNDEQYEASTQRGLDVIWDDFMGIKKHMVEAIESLDETILMDNRKFPWMEGEALSYLVYENAIWHEEEHAMDILDWREGGEEEV